MTFAEGNGADAYKPGFGWNRLARFENRCIHAHRVNEQFGFRDSIEQHGFFAKLRLHDDQVGLLDLAVHAAKHPARDGNIFTRTPEVAFALPKTEIGRGMAVRAVHDFECANLFGSFKQRRSETNDGVGNFKFRAAGETELPAQPRFVKADEPVGGPLIPDLGRAMVKW